MIWSPCLLVESQIIAPFSETSLANPLFCSLNHIKSPLMLVESPCLLVKSVKIPYFDHHFFRRTPEKSPACAVAWNSARADADADESAGRSGRGQCWGKVLWSHLGKVGSKKKVIPLFVGFQPSKVVVVQDFATIHSINDPLFSLRYHYMITIIMVTITITTIIINSNYNFHSWQTDNDHVSHVYIYI